MSGAAAKGGKGTLRLPSSPPAAVTPRARRLFLTALSETASATVSAQRADVDRLALYRLRHEDAAFARDWDAAREAGIDAIEDEAIRRARDGVEKPVIRGGETVGHVREYSDTLLMFFLRARRPDLYGASAKGDGGEEGRADPRALSDDQLAAIVSAGTSRVSEGQGEGEGER